MVDDMGVVTIFRDIHETKEPYHVEAPVIFERIRSGRNAEQLARIRKIKDKSKRDELKKQLPSVMFSGRFSGRGDSQLIEHSGLICLDFDGTTDKGRFTKDKYTYACFVSPSGNGLKVVVKIPPEPFDHRARFKALAAYYDDPDHFDNSCINIGRVCYESHDEAIYINEDSVVFTDKLTEEEFNYTDKLPDVPITDDGEKYRRLQRWADEKFGFRKHGRAVFVFQLASACNRFGVDRGFALHNLLGYEQGGADAFTSDEIHKAVKSAYSYTDKWNTAYFEDTDTVDMARREVQRGTSSEDVVTMLKAHRGISEDAAEQAVDVASTDGVFVFWQRRGKGIELSRRLYIDFLEANAFFRYKINDKGGWILCRKDNNQVWEVHRDEIKEFVFSYIKSLPDKIDGVSRDSIYELMAKGEKMYFNEGLMELIAPLKVQWMEDEKDKAWFYFSDSAVCVTAEGIERVEYIDLAGSVWRTQILLRDIELCDPTGCEFERFLANVCRGDQLRFSALASITGYLLHSFKDKSLVPAIVLTDEIISHNPEGGTGKGIYINGVNQFKRTTVIDGKNFDFSRSFAWQRVAMDTQVIAFQDVVKGFDFERLFSIITEGIEVEQKNRDSFFIPYERSPKIIITTNYVLEGEGSSNYRRRVEMEFSQHYNETNTPEAEFGHLLFDDWKPAEWSRFDNFMLLCCQLFLRNGIQRPDAINIAEKRFRAMTCDEFVEWSQRIDRAVEYDRKNLLEEFRSETGLLKVRIKTFNLWLSHFAKNRKWQKIERHSGAIRYVSFK